LISTAVHENVSEADEVAGVPRLAGPIVDRGTWVKDDLDILGPALLSLTEEGLDAAKSTVACSDVQGRCVPGTPGASAGVRTALQLPAFRVTNDVLRRGE
jgi:hypothetical protein